MLKNSRHALCSHGAYSLVEEADINKSVIKGKGLVSKRDKCHTEMKLASVRVYYKEAWPYQISLRK